LDYSFQRKGPYPKAHTQNAVAKKQKVMAVRNVLGCTAMVIFLGINVLGAVMRLAKAASRRQIKHKEGSAIAAEG
jgi:hypothetical protein